MEQGNEASLTFVYNDWAQLEPLDLLALLIQVPRAFDRFIDQYAPDHRDVALNYFRLSQGSVVIDMISASAGLLYLYQERKLLVAFAEHLVSAINYMGASEAGPKRPKLSSNTARAIQTIAAPVTHGSKATVTLRVPGSEVSKKIDYDFALTLLDYRPYDRQRIIEDELTLAYYLKGSRPEEHESRTGVAHLSEDGVWYLLAGEDDITLLIQKYGGVTLTEGRRYRLTGTMLRWAMGAVFVVKTAKRLD